MQPEDVVSIQVDDTGNTMQLEMPDGVFRPSVASTSLLFSVQSKDILGARVFDVGVGTGYIGLGLLLRGAASLVGSDLSELAVETARSNAKLNGFENLAQFFVGNLFSEALAEVNNMQKFDLIVSNPPIMPRSLERNEYGPTDATDGGEYGDKLVGEILASSPRFLSSAGVVYVPVFSYSNPDYVKKSAAKYFERTEVVTFHDVIFDHRKLASYGDFQAIFDAGHGYEVRHHGHPYWRIEILRCWKPKALNFD